MGSQRAVDLARTLHGAADDLIAVLEGVDDDRWRRVPQSGVWSIGKDAEHVAEAAAYHQWIVRLTIGEMVSSRRPGIERKQMVTELSRPAAIDLIRQRTEEGGHLLLGLSDEQLDLPTKPPRARGQLLAVTIEQVLIDHYHGHRAEVESKIR